MISWLRVHERGEEENNGRDHGGVNSSSRARSFFDPGVLTGNLSLKCNYVTRITERRPDSIATYPIWKDFMTIQFPCQTEEGNPCSLLLYRQESSYVREILRNMQPRPRCNDMR